MHQTLLILICTLDNSHHTGTTKVVQATKSVEQNIDDNKEMKIWD